MAAKMTFESAMKRLEEIVKSLEAGDSPLDEALKLFEEGVKLADFCNKALNTAEQKVTMLTTSSDGEMEQVDFGGKDNGDAE